MSILTREEFKALVWDQIGDGGCGCGACSESIVAAYDAALARIAELERHIEGLHCNAIEAMLPTIPKVPEMIGLESSSLFPEEK